MGMDGLSKFSAWEKKHRRYKTIALGSFYRSILHFTRRRGRIVEDDGMPHAYSWELGAGSEVMMEAVRN
jgi:hypothetical protein